MDYFISDTHLSHDRIIVFERTEFKTIEEHDEFVKNKILSTVKADDTLYMLGDAGVMTDENIEFWKNLPCKTILIRGNHDTQKAKLLEAFDEVSDVPIFYRKRILLSHEPLPVTSETINIHGHLHGAKLHSANHWNISFREADYLLVTEKEVLSFTSSLPKISQDFMFEWYSGLYQFTFPNSAVYFHDDRSVALRATRQTMLRTPKFQRKIYRAMKKFKQDYPNVYLSYDMMYEFMLNNYSSNANFTSKDVHSYIMSRRRKRRRK